MVLKNSCLPFYARMMETSILSVDAIDMIQSKEYQTLLQDWPTTQKWHYHRIGNQALETRFFPTTPLQPCCWVCYVWKVANPKPVSYPPSTIYFIDPITFPYNYALLQKGK